MPSFFLSATGTEIGKTYVASQIIQIIQALEKDVDYLKPIISGWSQVPEVLAESDTGLMLQTLALPLDEAHIQAKSPWRFKAPLSPDMAAALEGKSIDFDSVIEFCQKALHKAEMEGKSLWIEGVGGIMVPLNNTKTVLDWMHALQVPVVLVTGSYLGTLSHTLTAVEVLQHKGLSLAGLILNQTPNSEVDLDQTQQTLERFISNVPIITVPYGNDRVAQQKLTPWVKQIIKTN